MARWATRSLMLALALLGTASAWGQETNDGPGLPARLQRVDFRVVMGRISVLNARYGTSTSESTGNPVTGLRESFSINVAGGVPSVRYERTTETSRLNVDFVDSSQLSIVQQPVGPSDVTPWSFHQPATGDVTLQVGQDGQRREYRAASFWHLMLRYPDVCRQHLLPVLGLLRPSWRLEEMAASIESALVRAAQTGHLPDRQHFARLVAQLGSDSYGKRTAAERELMQMGQSVVTYLRSLPLSQLDAEQRSRVRRILEALAVSNDDTAERVSTWLIDDPEIWLTLLRADADEERQVAATHLARLLNKPIDFDPAADQATRDEQIERLQKSVKRR